MATWKSQVGIALVATVASTVPDWSLSQTASPSLPSEGMFSVSGLVIDVVDGTYTVRSDRARIQLQLSDWPSDFQGEGDMLDIGDSVTATGWLDVDTLSPDGALDVLAVYVEDSRTYYTLAQATTIAKWSGMQLPPPSGGFGPVEHSVSLVGIIEEIDGDEAFFSAGEFGILVNTSSLNYDPFDDVGVEGLTLGDTVIVDGMLEQGSDGSPQLQAQSLTRIVVVEAAD